MQTTTGITSGNQLLKWVGNKQRMASEIIRFFQTTTLPISSLFWDQAQCWERWHLGKPLRQIYSRRSWGFGS